MDKSRNATAVEDLGSTVQEKDMRKKPFVPIVLCSQQSFVLLLRKNKKKYVIARVHV